MPMSINFNCQCDDPNPSRTLAELRSVMFARLGIPDPIANAERRTLAEMRRDLMAQLGIPDPIASAERRTLGQLRSDLLARMNIPDPITDAERRSLADLRSEMLAQLGMFDMFTSIEQRTLAALRNDVMAQLGMTDPIDAAERRTLASLRSDLMARLGMPDPIESAERRSLSALRNDLMLRLGFAAQTASPPPGMPELLNQFIAEAEQVLWRRLELDRGGQAPPARLSADSDQTTLDAPMVFALALASAKAHYGQQDAELYLKKADQMMVDYAKRSPPGIRRMLDNIIAEAEQVLWRRLELDRGGQSLPPRMAQETDSTTLDAPMVFALALASAKGHFEQQDAKLYLEKSEQMLQDYARRSPPGLRRTVDSYIAEAEQSLWRRFELDKGGESPPARMTHDDDTTTLDGSLVFAVAIASAKAHYAQPDAELYLKKSEQMLADFARRSPPGIRRAVDSFIAEAEQVLWRRLELDKGGQSLPPRMASASSLTTLDAPLVFATALASAKGYYEQADAELHLKKSEQMLADYLKRNPPGIRKKLDSIISEAEQVLWRRLELDRGGQQLPARLAQDGDQTTLDAPLVFALALASAKASLGHSDADVYFKEAEQMLADFAKRSPPGIRRIADSFLAEAEQTLWRRLELDKGGEPLPARMDSDNDQTRLDAPLVFALALASAKAHFGQNDAELYFKKSEQMLSDYAKRSPPGIRKQVDNFLQEAQKFLYRAYSVLRTERFFTWQMQVGQRFYAVDGNSDSCPRRLDPRMVSWVGVSEGAGSWRSLTCGIPPESYQNSDQRGTPHRYEIRQCIEVWPAPDERQWALRIKGDFGLEPFSADGDRCTIDDEAVLLHALARAKAHFEQDDAAIYERDALEYVKNLTAGSHQTRRYVPGTRSAVPDGWPGWMRETH